MNYIRIYYDQIIQGKIKVSKKVEKEVAYLIHELDNPGKYHYDDYLANRPIRFIESFCKQSQSTWINKPIKLDLWQKAIIQALFGFVNSEKIRRYKEVLIIVGRKNGKSTLLSALSLYMLLSDGEGGAQVCCVASKKDQAKIVFNEAKNMVIQSPLLRKKVIKRKSDLYVPSTFSTFEPLSSDSNTLDGLNIHCGIIDELHTLKDRNIYDVTKQSMSVRRQPILFMITTAGYVRENIYDDKYDYACKVIEDRNVDEHFLPFIYELDSKKEIWKEENWVKANPGLGTIKSIDYLRDLVKQAKEDESSLPSVLTKEFDVRETGTGSWLTFDSIENKNTFDLKYLKNCYGIGGVDLSSVGDLTCASCLIQKEGSLFLTQMYFIPREMAEFKEQQDKVPYKLWEAQGYIRFCDGNKVNYTDVTDWYIDLRDKYGIYTLWVGYDSWNAQFWVEEMKNSQFTLEEVIQGAKTMSNPMKLLASDLKAKKINYNNNPILKWCLTNTQIETDKNDNIRPVKGRNKKLRIDGAMSLIDSYVVYQRHFSDFQNMI